MRATLLVVATATSVAAAAGAARAAYPVEELQRGGDPGNRVDLVFLGDGYRDVDQAQLTADVRRFTDRLFAEAPYKRYRAYFNIRVVHVVSNQTGADNGSAGGARDTALGTYYNCGGMDRLLCVDDAAVLAIAAADAPDYDHLIVLVNDVKYGGSGGAIGVFSIDPSASDLGIHELGHTMSGLADEYETAYPGFPACDAATGCPEPNATNSADPGRVPWLAWIEAGVSMPTPEDAAHAGAIGVYEGARYLSTGVYRPHQSCMMRVLGVPMCSVCREAGVLATYARIDPIDAAVPSGDVAITDCEPATFSITRPVTVPDDAIVTWELDGVAAPAQGDAFTVGSELGEGEHLLVARVSDPTPLVRNDPMALTSGEHTWNVSVARADTDADGIPDCAEFDDGASDDSADPAAGAPGDIQGGCAAAGASSSGPLLLLLLFLLLRRRL